MDAVLNRLWAVVLTTLINANSYYCIGMLGKRRCIRAIHGQDMQLLALEKRTSHRDGRVSMTQSNEVYVLKRC
jgi:hypothetical protein